MDIKILNIRKSNFSGATIAFLNIQIDTLLIDGFKIVKGSNGRFVSYPREQGKDGKWYDIVRPIDVNIKQEIENFILREYDKYITNQLGNDNEHSTPN